MPTNADFWVAMPPKAIGSGRRGPWRPSRPTTSPARRPTPRARNDSRNLFGNRTVSFQPQENAEPIPGYTLLERLGVGGCGEVWKVSAPGGLIKAMKFVYGRMDDDR